MQTAERPRRYCNGLYTKHLTLPGNGLVNYSQVIPGVLCEVPGASNTRRPARHWRIISPLNSGVIREKSQSYDRRILLLILHIGFDDILISARHCYREAGGSINTVR